MVSQNAAVFPFQRGATMNDQSPKMIITILLAVLVLFATADFTRRQQERNRTASYRETFMKRQHELDKRLTALEDRMKTNQDYWDQSLKELRTDFLDKLNHIWLRKWRPPDGH